MDKKIITLLLISATQLTGCATANKSLLLGGVIGGLAGAAIGQSNSQNTDGAVVGALVGSGIGGLIGYSSFKEKPNPKSDQAVKVDEEVFPSLTKPKLKSLWVPDKIEGNKYIKGHWIYVIEDAGSWSRD
jgi:hypothetical protein